MLSEKATLDTFYSNPHISIDGMSSFHNILYFALRYPFRLLLALLGPPAVAGLLIFVLPNVYRAQTSLVVGTGPEYLAPDGDNAINRTTSQSDISTEIELLTNPALVDNTVSRIGLADLYPELLNSGIGAQLAKDTAAHTFESALRVAPIKLSNVIQVTFEHGNGQMAARALDQFIQSYQELHAKVFAGQRAASYEERIARDIEDLKVLERTRAEIKATFGVNDLAQQRNALIQQRIEAEKQLRQTVDRADALSRHLADLAHAQGNLAAQQTGFAPRRLAPGHGASAATTEIDQDVSASQAELAPLKMQEMLGRMLIGVISRKMEHLEQADTQIRALDTRVTEQRENLRIARQLLDQAKGADDADRTKLSAVAQTLNAAVPVQANGPNKMLFMAGGMLAGLVSAYSVFAFTAMANRKAMTAGAGDLLLGLPVLETMPVRTTKVASLK